MDELPLEESDGNTEQQPTEELILFDIDGEQYAAGIATVLGVMRIPPVTVVPNAPPYVQGIITVRGKVVTVVDIEKRYHLERKSKFAPQHLVLVSRDEEHLGLIVDKVLGVLRVPTTDIISPSEVLSQRLGGAILRGVCVAGKSGATVGGADAGISEQTPAASTEHVILVLDLGVLLEELVRVAVSLSDSTPTEKTVSS